MSNGLFQDLKFKVFQSGNPSYLYIGLNTIVFVAIALVNLPLFLSGNGDIYEGFIRDIFGFPALISRLPERFYTILTYQFFHDGFLHLLFNMLWLFWMGRIFLDFMKPRQFHFIYLAGGFAGALTYLLAYNIFPAFALATATGATIIGSSASVMAIVVATATLVPDYGLNLLLFGEIKLKYLALAYIVMDVIGIATANAGGSFAHLGGALLGFTYIKVLQKGTDWSNIFKRKPKLRVVKNEFAGKAQKNNNTVDQKEIDAILDKISQTGYDKLSREEKDTLFKASKH
jgi:membrane associated rhomboid family serine protease